MRAASDPKFKDHAIYEHGLPFNESPTDDEARSVDTLRSWSARRDLDKWTALQG